MDFLIEKLGHYGPMGIVIALFVIRDYKREIEASARNKELEDYIRGTLDSLVRRCMSCIKINNKLLRQLIKKDNDES